MKYEVTFYKNEEIKQFYDCFVWKMNRRSEGRSTIEVENVIFTDFILSCIDFSKWKFPIQIKYDDKPDFVIESENILLGVELTEQWSKNYGHALVLSENSNGLIEPSDFNIDNDIKKLQGKKVAKLVSKQKLTGPPSMGFQEEVNWVKRTLSTANLKAQKYIKYDNYDRFDENYLVIFDVRPESPSFDDVTDNMLNPIYALSKSTPFTKIFCLDGHIIEIDLIRKKITIIRDKHLI